MDFSSRAFFRFPNPLNEVSARLVATGVVVMACLYLATGWTWLLAVLAYGFIARTLTGPTLSPLGQLVTRIITPRLPLAERPVPGPPKRFAQSLGAAMSLGALVLALTGFDVVASVLIAALAFFASLEAVLSFCLGCTIFAGLMRVGVIPEETCARCANPWGDSPA